MDLHLAGLTRIGQGRAAEVFALSPDRVIKVARPSTTDSLDREAAAMRAAIAIGMPVPAVHELVQVGDRRALVMSRVHGVDMLTELGRRPWMILRAGGKLGRLHALLHETPAPRELPSAKEVLEGRIVESAHVSATVRQRVLPILRELPDGDRLCHFDFQPANVIVNGPVMTVIDWPGACRGDPLADVAATLIALRGGKTPPGTPLITRLSAPLGRKLLLGGYLRAYRGHHPHDRQLLARWVTVLAAYRLTYHIDGEETLLLRTIRGAA
jgi:aminoglycoside phosphotransferase (APT) family kinase protein